MKNLELMKLKRSGNTKPDDSPKRIGYWNVEYERSYMMPLNPQNVDGLSPYHIVRVF